MEQSKDTFLDNDVVLTDNNFLTNDNNLDKIIDKIKKGNLNDILNMLCFVNKNALMINYIYFKYLGTETTYNYILMYITNNIDIILSKHSEFIVHVNMQKLSLGDIDKHQKFINNLSLVLKDRYPNKLLKCYIYKAPFMFKQIFNMISVFIDKETQEKIELVKT
jgi:hypothetical protein